MSRDMENPGVKLEEAIGGVGDQARRTNGLQVLLDVYRRRKHVQIVFEVIYNFKEPRQVRWSPLHLCTSHG